MIDFFQTLNVKRFVFADGDNVNNPKVFGDYLIKNNYLELDTQIICFVGANTNQNNWYNNTVKYIQAQDKNKLGISTSFNITPIRVQKEGENSLDMVLSTYIGLAMGQNPRAEFIIVANDKGYDSVVVHFENIGLKIKRVPVEMKKQTEEKDSEISHVAEIRREVLRTKISKRPAKEKGLKNVLLVNCRQYVSEKNVDLYYKALIDDLQVRRMLRVTGTKLEWLGEQ